LDALPARLSLKAGALLRSMFAATSTRVSFMHAKPVSAEFLPLLRLRVTADADPNALARVLERFQNLNVLPRRVVAEFGIRDLLHIQVDVAGVTEEQLSLITAKIGQATNVVGAYWHHV
jgi:hypothetical protein